MSVVDIFYLGFLPEVMKGEVYVPYCLNIGFNAIINNVREDSSFLCEDIIIPTLVIENQEQFDKLLTEYVIGAMSFYENEEDISLSTDVKIKKIIAFLFANATYNDFLNPIQFLKRRIKFFETEEKGYILGKSSILGREIKVEIKRDSIENETPYKFSPSLVLDDNEFHLPEIKFGICDNKAYVYAIQNPRKNIKDKKINRGLYKVGEGFDDDLDNYDIYEEGNLKDITPSFLVSLNLFFSYLNEMNIKSVEISTILIERWNAKSFSLDKRKRAGKISLEEYQKLKNKQLQIQENLTEKLIRTALRITSHYSSMGITSYPDENNYSLTININNSSKSNNSLLNEMNELMSSSLYIKGK